MGRATKDSDSDRSGAARLTAEEWHKAYPIAKFICRTAVEAMSTHDLDYVDLVLYMLAATTYIEKIFGDNASQNDAVTSDGDIHTFSISRASLAEDTRLPRETVRRRVANLVEKGWLLEDENGFLIVPPERFFNEANEKLFRFVFDEFDMLQTTFAQVEAAHGPGETARDPGGS